MIVNPITLSPSNRIAEALELMQGPDLGCSDYAGWQQGRPSGRI